MDPFLFGLGLAIGFAMAAPLGPVNMIVIRTAVRRGMALALVAGSGAILADTFFATVVAYGVRSVGSFVSGHAVPLGIAGGLLLVMVGMRTAMSHVSLAGLNAEETPSAALIARKFLTTLTLTLTNPGALFGFVAVFGAMGGVMKLGSEPFRPLTAVAGVALGGFIWWLIISYAASHFRYRLSEKSFDRINRWTGILIAAFGFAMLMELLL